MKISAARWCSVLSNMSYEIPEQLPVGDPISKEITSEEAGAFVKRAQGLMDKCSMELSGDVAQMLSLVRNNNDMELILAALEKKAREISLGVDGETEDVTARKETDFLLFMTSFCIPLIRPPEKDYNN